MWSSSVLVRRFAALRCFASLHELADQIRFRLKIAAQRAVGSLFAVVVVLVAPSGPSHADSAQYLYDPAGRLTGVIDPVNGSAQYNYDAVGNIVSVVRRATTDLFVAQVSPSRGQPGDTVTIFGTGFGTTANTSVSFNGVTAAPTAVSATQITVAVPSGAATGPVSVTSPAGTAASVANFTVPTLGPPTITSFSPSQIDAGGTLTISGGGFDVAVNDKVFVNSRYAEVTSATGSALTVVVPVVSSGRVTVSTPGGTATSSGYLVVAPAGILASNISGAVTGSLGSAATVNVGVSGQVGLLLFDATAGQHLAMQVTAASVSCCGSIQLYGPDGATVGSSASSSNGTFVNGLDLRLSGTYAVVVSPGGSGSTTINLMGSQPVTGTISANGEPFSLSTTVPGQDMSLSFSGTAGQRVSLLTQPNLGCSTLTVMEPNGLTLYSVAASGICNPDFSDALTLPVTGTYTIRLQPNGAITGTAAFTLYGVPPDASSTIAANGTAVSLTTTEPGQNMNLTFSGTAGQRVSLVTQPNNICAATTITAPDGTTQLYSNSVCSGTDFSGVLVLPTTGTYTIFGNPSGQYVGTTSFTLYTVPPDATATIAANGTAVSLTTTTPGQNGSLTFSGTAGQRVSLVTQINTAFLCESLAIKAPDGTTQLYSTDACGSDYSGVLILPTTGTYTISVEPNHNDTGAATFTLYTVPPDVTATIAANGTAVSLTTTAPGQNGSLTFSGTAGQRVSLVTQVNTASLCVSLAITAPDGTTQLYSTDVCGSDYSGVLVLPTTGTYKISANPNHNDTGTTTFTLYTEPADASATITPGGGSVALTTTVPGQNGSLTFSGTAGQRVSLLTQINTSFLCVSITITAPDGTTRLYSTDPCGSDFSGALVLPTTGTYTISADPNHADTGTTTFTLYNIPPDATGTATVGQAAANYTTTVPGQAIRVSFAGTSSQSVTVMVGVVTATPSSPCYRITTLAPDGTTVVRGDQSCSSGYSSGSLSLPQNGTYTVIVGPNNVAIGTFSVGVTTP